MMRCITAIWPAGPPKESAATLSHTRNASANETPWAGAERAAAPLRGRPRLCLCRDHGCRVPVVPLSAAVAAPGVEGVINGHPVLQHRVIVGVDGRKAQRHGQ